MPYLFISLIEAEHPLKTSNKSTHIALSIYFFNWGRTSIKPCSEERQCGFKLFKTKTK